MLNWSAKHRHESACTFYDRIGSNERKRPTLFDSGSKVIDNAKSKLLSGVTYSITSAGRKN